MDLGKPVMEPDMKAPEVEASGKQVEIPKGGEI
jgi:hypothetical protein